jgi:hypothetical protein
MRRLLWGNFSFDIGSVRYRGVVDHRHTLNQGRFVTEVNRDVGRPPPSIVSFGQYAEFFALVSAASAVIELDLSRSATSRRNATGVFGLTIRSA